MACVTSSSSMIFFNVSFAILLAFSHGASAATTHTVGGSADGWTIPANTTFYDEWASKQTFSVGDSLVFNFAKDAHNVIRVPKSSYDACSTKGMIGSTITTNPATVRLPSSGTYYFLCGVGGHCSLGQKVSVTVKATTSTSSSSNSPAPAPTAGGPSSSTTMPTGGPSPSASNPVGVPTPGQASSSPSSTPTGSNNSAAASVLGMGISAGAAVMLTASFLF